MSRHVRLLWGLACNTTQKSLWQRTGLNLHSQMQNVRTLYTDKLLGIKEYEEARQVIRTQYMAVEDIFRTKMKNACMSNEGNIYMEDLKAMTHIVQKSEADLQLLEDMLKNYIMHVNRPKNILLSPLLMRALFYLDEPQRAFLWCTSHEFATFFSRHLPHIYAMTLLYRHGMYQEIVEVFMKGEAVNQDEPLMDARRRILLYAALGKLDSPEALQTAKKTWETWLNMSRHPTSREINFYLYLLYKHQKYNELLDVLSDTRATRGAAHFRIATYIALGEYEKAHNAVDLAFDDYGYLPTTIELKQMVENIPEGDLKLSILKQLDRSDRTPNRRSFSNIHDYIYSPITERERPLRPRRRYSDRRNKEEIISTL